MEHQLVFREGLGGETCVCLGRHFEPLFSQNFPHFFGAKTRMEELTRLQASRRGHRGHLTKLMKKSEGIFVYRNDMTDLILASVKSTRDRL